MFGSTLPSNSFYSLVIPPIPSVLSQTHWVHVVLPVIPWVRLPQQGWALRDQILKKTESPSLSSCQLPMALHLVVGFMTASTSWDLAWLDLLQVLCMQLQLLWFHVWDCPDASWKQFCYSHPPSLALKISPPPLLRLPPEHWEEGVWWAEHPEVSCSLYTDH